MKNINNTTSKIKNYPISSTVYYKDLYWNNYDDVRKEINRRITGKSELCWFDHFKNFTNGRIFKKALILNCGNGWVERCLHEKGIIKEAVGIDYCKDLLRLAHKDADGKPYRK